jgi:Domain of unknown function (DUF5615)
VKVLLDENFPLGLVRVLQADGLQVEHIITLDWRGASDTRIRERLSDKDVVFLTQDDDFLSGTSVGATIIVSRVRQSRRLADRIDVWRKAIASFSAAAQASRVFELTDDGVLEAWRETPRP